MEKLIYFEIDDQKEEVNDLQKYPCLYNPICNSYNNKISRQNAWERVALECNIPNGGRLMLLYIRCH